jgi:uncharacterized protein involved in type VI secretion and phage assembly
MIFGQEMPGGGGMSDNSSSERKRVGVNIATVIDIDDPQKFGRVKCRFITGTDNVEDTEWAPVVTPNGGNESGIFFHPCVDDVVLLAFEEGDIHSPYVIGSVWWKAGSAETKPPVEDANKTDTYIITTPKKHMITLSEVEGKESIEIKTAAGNTFKLDDAGNQIILQGSDDNGITMNTQTGAMSIKCKEFELDVGGNKLTIGPAGLVMEASPKIEIKSASVTMEGSGTTTIKGSVLNLESSGVANLKGSMVKIN